MLVVLCSMAITMSDPRGQSTPSGKMIADRHFVLNVTTGLTSLACSIMESRDYAKTRWVDFSFSLAATDFVFLPMLVVVFFALCDTVSVDHVVFVRHGCAAPNSRMHTTSP